MKNLLLKTKPYILNKYGIVSLIFAFVFLIYSDYNIFNNFKYGRTINKLENEIKKYKKEIKDNKQKLLELQSNDYMLEKYGREEFYFKKENEDIYIIEEDDE